MPKSLAARAPQTIESPPGTGNGTPTWGVAYLFPEQGTWSEEDFFGLQQAYEGLPRVELVDGRLEVLQMPTHTHQRIMTYLLHALTAFAAAHAPGTVFPSGTNVRLGKGRLRQPDVVYMKDEHAARLGEESWDGADLVMEVVSPGRKDEERDWEVKPKEYARAGIPEYWIVDPQRQIVRVLTLRGKSYKVHGDFRPGDAVTSALLPGFKLDVDSVLAPPTIKPAK